MNGFASSELAQRLRQLALESHGMQLPAAVQLPKSITVFEAAEGEEVHAIAWASSHDCCSTHIQAQPSVLKPQPGIKICLFRRVSGLNPCIYDALTHLSMRMQIVNRDELMSAMHDIGRTFGLTVRPYTATPQGALRVHSEGDGADWCSGGSPWAISGECNFPAAR